MMAIILLRGPKSGAQKTEADLRVTWAVLHQALTGEKPTQHSRTALSEARYNRQGYLVRAGHTRKGSGAKSGRGKISERAGSQPSPTRTRAKRGGGIIYAGGGEAEVKIEKIKMQEEEDTGKSIMHKVYRHRGCPSKDMTFFSGSLVLGCNGKWGHGSPAILAKR